MVADKKVTHLRHARPCPICGKASTQKYHPFCSARCADVDLNRWLSGAYVIPARDEVNEEDESWGEDERNATPTGNADQPDRQ